MPSTHATVAELPGCPDGTQPWMGGFLHAAFNDPAFRRGGFSGPAGGFREAGRGLARALLAPAEFTVFTGVCQQEIETGNYAQAQK